MRLTGPEGALLAPVTVGPTLRLTQVLLTVLTSPLLCVTAAYHMVAYCAYWTFIVRNSSLPCQKMQCLVVCRNS